MRGLHFTYSISLCQFSVQPLVLLPQLADGLAVLLDGGLRALIVSSSVALWWTRLIVTPTTHGYVSVVTNDTVYSQLMFIGFSYRLTVASHIFTH